MGSSDLNLKKSWHVGRAANISAIAKAEADALAERKKLALRLNEIKEERKKEEIQKQLAAAGGKPVTQRVEWMYSGGPGDGQNGDSAANESFLLGKRTLDKLLVSQDNEAKQQLQKHASQDSLAPAPGVSNARDTAAKIREDPLLAIRRSEADAYGAMMNDPIKRRQLLASLGIDDPNHKSKDKEEKHHKHRHHHRRRHRDNHSDDEGRSRKRRRSDSRDRARSPRRHGSRDGDRDRRRRRRSPAEGRSRSRTRAERDHGDKRDRRPREQSRSRTPPRRRRDESRDWHDRRRDSYRDERNGNSSRRRRDYSEQRDRPRYNGRRPADDAANKERDGAEDERARKLAAMQEAASHLDLDRERRLAALQDADKAAREADDKARQRSNKLGGDRHFLNGLHHKASDMNLAERIGRGRQGLQRDED